MTDYETYDPGVSSPHAPVGFSPVSVPKFVVLSILTFGIYQVVWFYRNWRAIKRAKNASLWPWARALFAPIWLFALLRRLDVRERVGLAIAYWLVVALWRLPDPYWLVSNLSFLLVLPAVQAANRRVGDAAEAVPSFGWRKRSAVVAVLGVLAVPLVVVGSFGPPTAVVPGSEMRASDLAFLEETGLLEEGEEILYFYSTGLLSIQGKGVFASNLGITSYWTDPVSDELMVAFLRYRDIYDIEVNYSDHPLEDTVVRVQGPGDAWFIFFLSAESGGDRRFLDEVELRRTPVATPRISA